MNKHEMVCYNTDASRLIGNSQAVFFPENIREVQTLVKTSKFDIVPRGAGTNPTGGCIPKNSIVIDLCKMNNILDFSPVKKQILVEAGITIKELNDKLRKLNFEFPIYFSDNKISTIGGMIALNSPGDRSMKYGNIKDWIDEIQLINGKGELIKISKADSTDVCGMEGITGIIVSVKLRIIRLAKRTASVFQTDSVDEILVVGRKIRTEKEVSMLRFFSKKVSKLLGFPEKNHLFVEFDSDRGKINGEEYENLIKTIGNAKRVLFSEGYYNIEDPKTFFDKLKELLLFLEINKVPYFCDLGLGIIYAFFKDEEKNKKKEFENIMMKTRIKPGKYGFGLSRKHFLDPFEAKLIQRLKSRYDSKSKFNNGKVFDIEMINFQSCKDESRIAKKTETKPVYEDTPVIDKKFSEEAVRTTEESVKIPVKASVDYSDIRKIMTNQNRTSESNGANNEIKRDSNNSLEKKSERDVINSIMTNKFGMSIENNKTSKNEENKNGGKKDEPGN